MGSGGDLRGVEGWFCWQLEFGVQVESTEGSGKAVAGGGRGGKVVA